MSAPESPRWLGWLRRLEAIAQTGLHHAAGPFDVQRYQELRSLAAEMIAQQLGGEEAQVQAMLLTGSGYATPKVDLRGVVFRDGALLLVKERADGLWTLPGGWADVNESPGVGAAREVLEESGFVVRPTKLLACYDKLRHAHPPELHHAYKLFFLCELEGGAPTPSLETEEVGFFSEGALPALSLPRNTPEQLARMFEHLRHPQWPTDFD